MRRKLAVGMVYGATLAAIFTLLIAIFAILNGDWRFFPLHIVFLVVQGMVIAINIQIIKMEDL